METANIIQEIDAEIERLERARAVLAGQTSTKKSGTDKRRKRGRLSAAGRARIAAAQKKRWAKLKKK